MGFWDRLMGNDDAARTAPQGRAATAPADATQSEDERAIERYRYLLRTAPPETIEQVHAEAFAQLTEPQRQQVLAELSAGLDPAEQPRSTDPQAMARAATRAEYRSPGFMERTLGPGARGGQGGPGMGAMIGSSLLGTVAGYVIGSALVSAFMAPAFADGSGNGGSGDGGSGDGGSGDGGSGDGGSVDAAGADAGVADGGGFGGDVGGGFGGDFGGGDFGGGDFGGF